MSEDQNEEHTEAAPETVVVEEAPKPRMSAKAWLALGIFLVVAGSAVYGIINAFTAVHEDPSSVTIPSYSQQSLMEKYPLKDVIHTSPINKESGLDVDPELMDDEEQNETPLKLKGQTPAAKDVLEKKSVLEKSELKKHELDLAHQSKIKWDEPKTVIAPKVDPISKNNPEIAIVIDDMGLNVRNSLQMAQISAPITLAYMPYAQNLAKQTKTAHDNGHELIVHMPMEPDDIKHNNPGPNALLTTNSAKENLQRLDHNLKSFEGYIGLNNHMGSKMTASESAMRPVMQSVKDRGLWFLDSRTIGNSVAGKIAAELNIPYVTRDIFLDNVDNVQTILAQLRQTEQVARKRGYAVAIGHPYSSTIAALKLWLPEARQKGFKLVPLSAIIAERYPAAPVPKYAQLKKTIVLTQHGTANNQ